MIAVLREAWRTARSQPVASIAALVLVAGMCATVLVTSGRTVGAEQAVLATLDAEGTRTVIVRADAESGLDTSVLDRLDGLEGVEWIGAFGPAVDAWNAAIPDGVRVPVRALWGDGADALPSGSAAASGTALDRLGMLAPSGSVITSDGREIAITAQTSVPEGAQFLEPVVVLREDTTAPAPVAVLVVVAESAELVAPLGDAVRSVLGEADPSSVSVETSEQMAELRGVLQSQLGSRGRELVLGVLVATSLLVGAVMHALSLLRRKDFGRRRALGASRRLIVALVLAQSAILSATGAIAGSLVAGASLALAREPLPGVAYFGALVVLATALGTLAAVIPAITASRREPLVELRVP